MHSIGSQYIITGKIRMMEVCAPSIRLNCQALKVHKSGQQASPWPGVDAVHNVELCDGGQWRQRRDVVEIPANRHFQTQAGELIKPV